MLYRGRGGSGKISLASLRLTIREPKILEKMRIRGRTAASKINYTYVYTCTMKPKINIIQRSTRKESESQSYDGTPRERFGTWSEA